MKNEMIKKQAFGVEIEMTGITREDAATTIQELIGGTITGPSRNCYKTRTIKAPDGRKWKVERDSSIVPTMADDEKRCEFVTPVLKYEDIDLLQDIVSNLVKRGAEVNNSCGIHIHVDGANHTPKSLLHLEELFLNRQDLIYESLDNESRSDRWCKKTCAALVAAMKAERKLTMEKVEALWYSRANSNYSGGISHEHYNTTRYHGLNLHAFFTKGTVEFRLFNSTLDTEKIKSYIQFCLAVSGWAISTKNTRFKSLDGLSEKQKVVKMRAFLTNRLGLSGEEFHTCRIHMLEIIKRNAGIRHREVSAA